MISMLIQICCFVLSDSITSPLIRELQRRLGLRSTHHTVEPADNVSIAIAARPQAPHTADGEKSVL